MARETRTPVLETRCQRFARTRSRIAVTQPKRWWRLPRRSTHLQARARRANVNTVTNVPERWTRASIYPDMWVDPDRDPRNTDGVSPDGELATLQDYLTSYRLTLQMKCEGLGPGDLARRSVPPSTMSLLGLLRHLAEAERDWRNWVLPATPAPKLYGAGDAAFEGAVGEQALVEGAVADLAREQAATDAVLAVYQDLGTRVGQRGIAVREPLGPSDRGVRPPLRARRFAARMYRRPSGAIEPSPYPEEDSHDRHVQACRNQVVLCAAARRPRRASACPAPVALAT